MNSARQRRFLWVFILLVASTLIVGLVLYALRQNINLFYTPAQIISGEAPKLCRIRIGGMVEKNSLAQGKNLEISFILSDLKEKVKVHYSGILPDLFREGQGVVASGQLQENNIFLADEILAKHDENYMPPEVAKIMSHSTKEKK